VDACEARRPSTRPERELPVLGGREALPGQEPHAFALTSRRESRYMLGAWVRIGHAGPDELFSRYGDR
jgi:hypothetical protein